MTDRLAEIRARLDAGASDAAHWRVTEDTDYSYRRAVVITSPDVVDWDEPFDDYIASGIRDDETADFIAHAPADIAWLLDEVEAWRRHCGCCDCQRMRGGEVIGCECPKCKRYRAGERDA